MKPQQSRHSKDSNDSIDCRRDARFVNTTETLNSDEQLITAENYQVASQAPIVRNVSEEEKRFVGDLTEMNSPVTDSENPSSTATLSSAHVAAHTRDRRQRLQRLPTSQEKSELLLQLEESAEETTVEAATAESPANAAPAAAAAAAAAARPFVSLELKPLKPLTTAATAAVASLGARPIRSASRPQNRRRPPPAFSRPMMRVASYEWRDLTSSLGAFGAAATSEEETAAEAEAEAEDEDTENEDLLLDTGHSFADQQQLIATHSTPEADLSLGRAMDESATPDDILRTRFEMAYDQAPKLPLRVLQKFDVTYERLPELPTPAAPVKPPQRRASASVNVTVEESTPTKGRGRDSADLDPLAKWDINQMIAADTDGERSGKFLKHYHKEGSDNSSYEDPDMQTISDADLLSLPKREKSKSQDPTSGLGEQLNSQEDPQLFEILLENLDRMMRGADANLSRPNVYTVHKLVSKEAVDYGARDSKATTKNYQSTAILRKTDRDIVSGEKQLDSSPDSEIAPVGAGAAFQEPNADMVSVGAGGSSRSSSPDDVRSIIDGSVIGGGAAAGRQTKQPRGSSPSEASLDQKEGTDPIPGLQQVYSSYLAGDSHDRVKRQIAYHYLTQAYGSKLSMLDRDDPGESEVANRKKRDARIKSSRLSSGFRYCSYLLPFAFILATFGGMFYYAVSILLATDALSMTTWLLVFTSSTAACAIFYWYNIFAPEDFAI